jgi:3-deoxy-D-manno-octulosonic-acid transferase
MRLILLLYNLALWLLLPFGIAYFLLRRLATGRGSAPLAPRLGLRLPPAPPAGAVPLWLHAVSVGEVLVMAPLVEEILRRVPGAAIYISTVTPTGQATAIRTFGARAQVFYCPFDLSAPVRRVMRRIRPRHLVIAETELWPSLLSRAHRDGVPVSVVNGRISDRSLPRYLRVRPLLRPFLALPERFLMQTEQDAGRIRRMGAPPERVSVTGNMKFDALRHIQPNPALAEAITALWGVPEPQVLLCGSTMEGEEEILAGVFGRLRPRHPALRLLVAPRHPERFPRAAEAFSQRGLAVFRRSRLGQETPAGPVDVVILDSLGELAALYPLAAAVFIGGTLAPTGGHNVLEPAAAGRAILVGPSMENFREIADLFLGAGALLQARDAAEFETLLARLLEDPARRRETGARAAELLHAQQGATGRNAGRIFGPAPDAAAGTGPAEAPR